MIPEPEICCAALLMVKHYGDDGMFEAAEHATSYLTRAA
jgi:hypothetical protein